MGCLIIPFIVALLCCLCKSQDADDISLILRTLVDGQYQTREQLAELSTKLEQQSNTIGELSTKLGQQSNAIGELSTKLEQQSNAIGDLKKSMNELHIFLPQEHQEIMNSLQICSSRDQIDDFKDLFTTDECFEGSHNCSEFATCNDQMINYQCHCLSGYFGDGFACQDIDECISENNTCGVRESCINKPGSYICICEGGYRRKGNTCEDIDECISGNITCGVGGTCINDPGSYNCICAKGYKKEGYICQAPVCESPSKLVEGLGCITPVRDTMFWDAAQTNCERTGTRLLEGFGKEHSTLFRDLFPSFKDINVWIGVRDWQWVITNDPVAQELWYPGYPNRGDQNRAFLHMGSSPYFGLLDNNGLMNLYSFCQLPY